MEDKIEIIKEMGELKAEMSGISEQVKALRERIDEVLISQVRDHGERIAALENWRVWLIGWAAGVGVVSHFIIQLFGGE